MSSTTELHQLIQGLDLECKTQVACRRSRADLLKIKKLTDTIRKELLTHSQQLKAERPKKTKAEEAPAAAKEEAPEPAPKVKV